MTTKKKSKKKKSKKKKVKKKEDWSEISFSTSELTYYDLIVEEKNLNSIEKINEQISNVIEGGENESTSHMVLGDLNHYKDKALNSSYLKIDSTDITSFDYTIENQGKLVAAPKKGEVVFIFYYRYDHAGYSLTKNKNFTNVCFKVKSFKNEALLAEMYYDPGFELTAHDASGGGVMYLEIICANGKTFEGMVADKDDLIQEFHTYLTNKQKKLSQEKGKKYLIKISPSFLFTKINNWENDEGLDDDNNPTQEATDYCIVQLKAFIDELKEKVDGIIGEKILISTKHPSTSGTSKASFNPEDFHELSEFKNTFKSNNWEDLNVYILLTKEISGKELNSTFLSMSDYAFGASYITEGEIVTQGYDDGEYDTGYFAVTLGNWDLDVEQYVSKENSSYSHMSLEEYNKVLTYLTNKQKKLSQDKGKNYLIKIFPHSLFSEITDLDEGMDKDRNPTEKGKNNFVDQMKSFIDEFKEKFDGVIGEKILISYNSEDFYDLSELKNTLDSNFEELNVYILLKTKILGEELNNIFLSMSDYGFYADYPNDEEKIITQGYDKGEYDTGYFAANAGNDDPEGYISDKNNPMSLSLKKYNEVMKTLAE